MQIFIALWVRSNVDQCVDLRIIHVAFTATSLSLLSYFVHTCRPKIDNSSSIHHTTTKKHVIMCTKAQDACDTGNDYKLQETRNKALKWLYHINIQKTRNKAIKFVKLNNVSHHENTNNKNPMCTYILTRSEKQTYKGHHRLFEQHKKENHNKISTSNTPPKKTKKHGGNTTQQTHTQHIYSAVNKTAILTL